MEAIRALSTSEKPKKKVKRVYSGKNSSPKKKKVDDAERVKRAIAESSDIIRRKYQTLKVGQSEADAALEKNLAPVVEPLKRLTAIVAPSRAPSFVGVKRQLEEPGPWPEARKKIKTSVPTIRDAKPVEVEGETPHRRIAGPPRGRVISEAREQPREEEEVFESDMGATPGPSTDVSPFDEILQTPELQEEALEYIAANFGPLTSRAFKKYIFKKGQADEIYGVRYENGAWMIGAAPVDMTANDEIVIQTEKGPKKFAATAGLLSLIFEKQPDAGSFTSTDLRTYKTLLELTHAHRRGYAASGQLHGSRGTKWTEIIAPLFAEPDKEKKKAKKKSGQGLPAKWMTLTNNKVDYVRWDDPNELVERLEILIAARAAGNAEHDNEIVEIVEELREAGVVR